MTKPKMHVPDAKIRSSVLKKLEALKAKFVNSVY